MPATPRDPQVHTKLVATLGPASDSPETLADLLDRGVDVCRLNFSHGDFATHKRTLNLIRAWEKQHDRPVAVLGDLCGPKIRLTRVAGGSFEIAAGQVVHLRGGDEDTAPGRFCVNYEPFAEEVQVGHRIFIDDGLIRLFVTEARTDALVCTCTVGGTVSSHKGVNLPDTQLNTPALTDKDHRDLEWAIENDLDFVALSFVRNPKDVHQLREIISDKRSDIGVILKIEKAEALAHIDELIALADGIMVARGDLGVEMDVWRVPLVQKDITRRCRESGTPVIIATQMLQSMVDSPMPTRAEVSDVANAILDRTDAVMLSAESAVGKYPSEAVDMMNLVAEATERYQATIRGDRPADESINIHRTASAIARAAVQAALHIDARLVVAWTATGLSARLVAQYRLPMPVVGLTYTDRVCRKLNLLFGVIPMRVNPKRSMTELADVLDRRLLDRGLVRPGDLIVVVTATHPTAPGNTDTTLIHRISPPR